MSYDYAPAQRVDELRAFAPYTRFDALNDWFEDLSRVEPNGDPNLRTATDQAGIVYDVRQLTHHRTGLNTRGIRLSVNGGFDIINVLGRQAYCNSQGEDGRPTLLPFDLDFLGDRSMPLAWRRTHASVCELVAADGYAGTTRKPCIIRVEAPEPIVPGIAESVAIGALTALVPPRPLPVDTFSQGI